MHNGKRGDQLAGFWHRYSAVIIDLFVMITLSSSLTFLPIFQGPFASIIMLALSTALFFVYHIFCLTAYEKTIGKSLMGLRVCDISGSHISFGQACIRTFVCSISNIFFSLGHLAALFSDKNQTLHDLSAKTIVTTNKEGSNLKYAFYSFILTIFLFAYSILINLFVLGTASSSMLFSGGGGFPKEKTINTEWISKRAIKDISVDLNKAKRKLLLRQFNRMPYLVRNLKKANKIKDHNALSNPIPLKLKGVSANHAGNQIEIFHMNNFFYNTLNYQLFDQEGTKLRKHFLKDYGKIKLIPFWRSNKNNTNFVLTINIPVEYTRVIFSRKRKVGTAYKTKNGTVVKMTDYFKFSIKGNDFDDLKFIPMNSSKKYTSVEPNLLRFGTEGIITFNSAKIAYVAMIHVHKNATLMEKFRI